MIKKIKLWSICLMVLICIALSTICFWSVSIGFDRAESRLGPIEYNFMAWPGIQISMALLVAFILLALCFGRMIYDNEIEASRLFWVIICCCLLIIIAFSIVSLYHYRKVYISNHQESVLVPITLDELDLLDTNGTTGIVYIGRDSCSKCQLVKPTMEEQFAQEGINILYYNTSLDREKNYDYMLSILSKYEVYAVPTIFVIIDGELIDVFSYESIVDGTALQEIMSSPAF